MDQKSEFENPCSVAKPTEGGVLSWKSSFAGSRTVSFHLRDCVFIFEVIWRTAVLTHIQNIKGPRTLHPVCILSSN